MEFRAIGTNLFLFLFLLVPISLSACALGGAWRCPPSVAEPDSSLFQFSHQPFDASLSTIKEGQYQLTFPSAYASGFPANDRVHGFYYRPSLKTSPSTPNLEVQDEGDKRAPFILLLHGYGEKRGRKEPDLARALAREGWAVLLLTLPYHFERSPDGAPPAKYMMVAEPEKTVAFYRQAVLDVRRALDWAQSRPEIDKKRMAVVGISLGAMVGNLALGVEDRLTAGVSVVGGADPAKFVWESIMMIGIRSDYQREGYEREQLERLWASINGANYLRGKNKPLLMINGRWDYVMPYECVESLACAAPQAKISWMWSGHWGPLLFPERIHQETIKFLKEVMP